MVYIKGGTFQMGSNEQNDEKPIHSVTVSNFYMSKYEVTNEEFCTFLNDYGSDKIKSGEYNGEEMIYLSNQKYDAKYDWGIHKRGSNWQPASGYENHPVIFVTCYGANEYCEWLSKQTGEKYSLPTESQWEYAAGGGVKMNGRSSQRWAGTNSESSLGNYAWYSSNSDSKTHQVGTKSPNPLGLYDMSGNVWEWCLDWYKGYPGSSGVSDYTGSYRVISGGSWGDSASSCRVANRLYDSPSNSGSIIGFRVSKEY